MLYLHQFLKDLIDYNNDAERKGSGSFNQGMVADRNEGSIVGRLKKAKLNEEIMKSPFKNPNE